MSPILLLNRWNSLDDPPWIEFPGGKVTLVVGATVWPNQLDFENFHPQAGKHPALNGANLGPQNSVFVTDLAPGKYRVRAWGENPPRDLYAVLIPKLVAVTRTPTIGDLT
jgi:hypothetical protein